MAVLGFIEADYIAHLELRQIPKAQLHGSQLPGDGKLGETDMIQDHFLVILIGKAPGYVLAAVYQMENELQQGSWYAKLYLFHRQSGHIHIQVHDGHGFIQPHLLDHAWGFLYPLDLEVDINVIGKPIL